MSAADTYKIIVSGNVAPGHDLKHVQDAFCDLFRVAPEQVKQFFKGKPRVIREGLNSASATVYLTALENIGLQSKLMRDDQPKPPEGKEEGSSPESSQEDAPGSRLKRIAGVSQVQVLGIVAGLVVAGGAMWQVVS
jgi:hypothetical protein